MAPASEEVAIGKPFVGRAGRVLNNALYQIGLPREAIWITNLSESPLPKDGSFFDLPHVERESHLNRLGAELEQVKPNVILLLGNDPLEAITTRRSISKWRGSILRGTGRFDGIKCVAAYHPAFIVRGMFKWEPVFTHVDLKRAVEESVYPDIRLPVRNSIVGPSYSQVVEYIDECATKEYLSFDIETVGHREISCVGIGYRTDEALCIPFTKGGIYNYFTLEEEADIWLRLAALLQNPSIKKVAQNAAFEWLHFWRRHIFPKNLWIDTMLLHHCLYPNFGGTEDIWRGKRDPDNPGHGLAFINSQYTKTPYYKDDGRKWIPDMGDRKFWEYNCYDVMCTLDPALQMEQEAKECKQWDVYLHRYVRTFERSLRMEWQGTPIDITLREFAKKQYASRLAEIQLRLHEVLGFELNVNSPQQIQNLLYKTKGYQVRNNPKTKRPTVDKTVLAYYAEKKQDE